MVIVGDDLLLEDLYEGWIAEVTESRSWRLFGEWKRCGEEGNVYVKFLRSRLVDVGVDVDEIVDVGRKENARRLRVIFFFIQTNLSSKTNRVNR